MYGGYDDMFVRTEAGWRIARRRSLEYRPGQPQIAADSTLSANGGGVRHPGWP